MNAIAPLRAPSVSLHARNRGLDPVDKSGLPRNGDPIRSRPGGVWSVQGACLRPCTRNSVCGSNARTQSSLTAAVKHGVQAVAVPGDSGAYTNNEVENENADPWQDRRSHLDGEWLVTSPSDNPSLLATLFFQGLDARALFGSALTMEGRHGR